MQGTQGSCLCFAHVGRVEAAVPADICVTIYLSVFLLVSDVGAVWNLVGFRGASGPADASVGYFLSNNTTERVFFTRS